VRNVARLFRAVEDSYVLQGWRKREHVYVRPFTPKWPPFVSASRALLPSGDSGRNGRRFRVGPFIRRAPTVLPRMIILPTFSMKKCTKKKKETTPHARTPTRNVFRHTKSTCLWNFIIAPEFVWLNTFEFLF
jgi:hypothetical protein